jgi:Tfp pilus tip-associated adhesin PilY1
MKTYKPFMLAVLLGAFAFASGARAQGVGDMDFLTSSVPPNVMIQFDTSGSMRQVVLPDDYRADRGTGNPSVWFNRPSNSTATRPAAFIDTSTSPNNWENSGSGIGTTTETYERTCQIFPTNTNNSSSQSICTAGSTSCANDDDFNGQVSSGAVMKCWNVPGGCSNVPSDLSCTTSNRARRREGGSTVSQPYTVITLPDHSFTSTTEFPPNYMWWIMHEVYSGNTPVAYVPQDRTAAAKQAVKELIDQTNVDGQPAKVKFGLARYHSGNNGGYIVVEPALENKAALFTAVDDLPADGSTPASETLVDVGRYFAGAARLGTYTAYGRNLTGGTSGTIPGSPISNSCEKNFVIVVTDGLPTEDCHNHHGTAFNTSIGNYDGVGGDSPSGQCNSGGGATNWLDDVAKYLHDNDLRPDMIGLQNLFVYTVGFNVGGSLLQNTADLGHGRYYNTSTAADLSESLIEAVNEIVQRNTSFSSATVPSTRTAFGDGFYTAYFLPGGQKGVWRGHLEAYKLSPSLDVLDQDGVIALDPITNEFVEPRNPYWDAAATVLAQYASRTLYTTQSGARVPFTTTDVNNAVQLGVTFAEESLFPHFDDNPGLLSPVGGANPDEPLGDAIVNYVHGRDAFDEDLDGNVTEAREWVFGDVFHSNPVAVGPAMPFLRNETGYGPATDASSFMGRYGLRQRVLYVGANDGMLHAFDAGSFQDPDPNTPGDEFYSAGDGTEKFGYIPGFLLDRVKRLPQEDVGKLYFVDGSGSAADVFVDYDGDGIREGSEWTTALLMPMRQGGEGIIALDVTDPNASSGNHGPYPRLMWELSHAALGETWSRPIITRLKMRATAGTGDLCGADDGDVDCTEQWVAIFGAGYRSESDPNLLQYTNDPNSPTYTEKGRGVFIVRIADGTVLARLRHIPGDATFGKMRYAIPGEPAVIDTDFDGFADVVYVGDLGGQLWKWDISAIGVTTAGVVPTSIWPAGVMFEAPTATVAAGRTHYLSIFQSPAAAYVQNVLTISFASGERTDMGYIGESDPNDPNDLTGLYDDNNRFWVLKDETPTGTGAIPALPIVEAPSATNPSLTDVTNLPTDNVLTDAGYFFKVADGEKFISNHLIFGGVVLTLSYEPAPIDSDPEDDGCTLSGQTNQWAWELETGGGTLPDPADSTSDVRTLVLGNGAPTDPRLTISKDLNGNLVIKITAQTSTGAIANPDPPPNSLDLVDMIYWRQNF